MNAARRYGEPITGTLVVVGGIRTLVIGAMIGIACVFFPLILTMLFVERAPELSYEERTALDALGRGFGGYLLLVGLGLAALLPVVNAVEGICMRRARKRESGLILAGPARAIAHRRSNETVALFSFFGIVIGPIGLGVGLVRLFSNSAETAFALVAVAVTGAITFLSVWGLRWGFRVKDLFSRPDIRRSRAQNDEEPNSERSTGMLVAAWAGTILLNGGFAMLAPVAAFSRGCDAVASHCELQIANAWALPVTIAALVVGLVLVIVVAAGDSMRLNKKAAALAQRAETGQEEISVHEAEDAVVDSHPLEMLARVLGGLLAIFAGLALAPQVANSDFGGSSGLPEFSPIWIPLAVAVVLAFAVWADWRGAQARNSLFALVRRTAAAPR